eukprot:jgi/Tetstr1/426945/TSEL_017158.t1
MSEYGFLTRYGATWTHNTGAKPTGAQAYVAALNNGSDVVVQGILKNKIRIYANIPPSNLAAMLTKYTGGRSIHLHEIVCGDRPAKVYFDYDKEIDESADGACHADILNEHRLALVEKLRATLGEGIETRVSGSIGKSPTSGQLKVSIHLVLHNRFTASLPDRKALRGVARALGCDDKVYCASQQFKLPGQRKFQDPRTQDILDDSDAMDHVLCIIPEHAVPLEHALHR